MTKIIFKNNFKSYLAVVFLGIFGGLLVAFFSGLPASDLWAFSYFSSNTFGFWMFSVSTIVLLSEKKLTAFLNSGIYVFLMFFVTGVYKYVRNYMVNSLSFESQAEHLAMYGYTNIGQWILQCVFDAFLYGIEPALVCAVLAFVLHFGRKPNVLGKILMILPAVYLLVETVIMYVLLFSKGTMLFMAIVDTLCLAAYLMIFGKYIINKKA
ncbi:MAG: hypothetical protein Q4B92_02725 [Ruminococcus sp.]|nr:hypothetical protein [Ruminococcus sp.]